MASSLLEDAKGVDETRIDQSIERSPLLGAESGVFDIFFRTGQVDFLMGYIEVSAEKNRLLLPQSTEMLQKSSIPFKAVVQASQCILGIGGVDINQSERIKFQILHPSFLIVLLKTEAYTVLLKPGGVRIGTAVR